MRKIIMIIAVILLLLLSVIGFSWYKSLIYDPTYDQGGNPLFAVPDSVMNQYDEMEKSYGNSVGAFLQYCTDANDNKIYIVTGNGGFTVNEYYFYVDGKLIDKAYGSDVEGESKPSKKINISDYSCKTLKEKSGE